MTSGQEWGELVTRAVVWSRDRVEAAKEDRLRFELKPNIGMDFGYVDPNAIEKTYYEAGELRTLYIYEEVYQNEMTTKQIAAACRKIARHGELIRADNAAKQVIVDLRTDYGINEGQELAADGL